MKTKRMLHLAVEDENNKIVDYWNMEAGREDNLDEIEAVAIETVHKIDELMGREYRNLHADVSYIKVLA